MEKGFLQERIPVVHGDGGAATEEEAREKFKIHTTEGGQGPEYLKNLRCLTPEEREVHLMGKWNIPPNPIRLNTIQKRENLNRIYRTGEPGPGGAYHDYDIYPASDIYPAGLGPESMEVAIACIEFQKGPRNDHNSRHGVLDSDLLEIVRDRLTAFQSGPMATRENEMALYAVEVALMWMNRRVEDRIERNVLGTMEK